MLKTNLHFHRAGMKEAEHGLNKSLPEGTAEAMDKKAKA